MKSLWGLEVNANIAIMMKPGHNKSLESLPAADEIDRHCAKGVSTVRKGSLRAPWQSVPVAGYRIAHECQEPDYHSL